MLLNKLRKNYRMLKKSNNLSEIKKKYILFLDNYIISVKYSLIYYD